jgi:hypothetical protein
MSDFGAKRKSSVRSELGQQMLDTDEKNSDRADNHEDADRAEKHLKQSVLHFTEYNDKQMDPGIKQHQGNQNVRTGSHATSQPQDFYRIFYIISAGAPTVPIRQER